MSGAIVTVEGLGKRYRVGSRGAAYFTLRDSLAGAAGRLAGLLRGARSPQAADFWALQDVSFQVQPGEVVGIIGRNGAGKSTLLKILSRITEPTAGRAVLRGRVGSLLEVGTGFHPELTGRENVYLSGAVLGMKKAEIDRQFDEIVAFAGVEQFLDTPVKHYSSGMNVRLGFAVAAHLDPEILLVDEVLAVGDAEFQKKCLGKMGEVARGGRTVLLVSHNMAAVNALCSRGVVLDAGRAVYQGFAGDCVEHYAGLRLELAGAGSLEAFRRKRLPPDWPVRFVRLSANATELPSRQPPVLTCGQDLVLEMEFEVRQPVRGANVTLVISHLQGERALVVFSGDRGFHLDLLPPRTLLRCRLRGLPLAPRLYHLDAGVNTSSLSSALDVICELPAFSVESVPQTRGQFPHRPWGAFHWDAVEWELGGE